MYINSIILADVKSYNIHGKSSGHYIPLARNYMEIFKDERFFVAGGPVYSQYIDEAHYFKLPFDSINGKNTLLNKLNVLRNCLFLLSKTNSSDKIIIQHSGASTTFLGIALFAKRKSNIYVIQ